MPVTTSYREYVQEQLGRVAPIATRHMFGGVGLYCRGLFFALMDDDRLYFKVDDSNRSDFENRGMGPFHPFGDETYSMHYYEVPGDVLEDLELLGPWVTKAVTVARRKREATEAGRSPTTAARRRVTRKAAATPRPKAAKRKGKKVKDQLRDKDKKHRKHKKKKKKKR